MAVRQVLRIGHPVLLDTAKPVQAFNCQTLDALIQDMLDTMSACNGAGLAAPQIGVSERIVIFGIDNNPRYPEAEAVPLTVLINPEIEALGTEQEEDWEGCLSVPGMRGLVPRFKSIRYRGFDAAGNEIVREADGFHARVAQHEVDHLDGILYPQRIEDMRQFGFIEELFPDRAI
jgi:peptide deformylase